MKSKFIPGTDIIPVSGATITQDDIDSVISAAKRGWFTEGEDHKKFTHTLRNYLGRPVTLCNSGSSALLLALETCREYFNRPKGYILTCATGFPTTITPAIQAGYVPYFVDIDRKTLNVNTDKLLEILKAYGENVVGVVLAHTMGFPFDAELIRKHLSPTQFLIEDCSDALGAMIRGNLVGTFGDVSTFSFFPAHHITTGEGGAVAYKNGRMLKIGNSYCNWGRDCWCKPGDSNTCNKRFDWEWRNLPDKYDHKYTFTRLGYNLKMTELQAALGLSQFGRLDSLIDARESNFAYLYLNFPDKKEHIDFVVWDHTQCKPSPFGFPITVTSEVFTRDDLVKYLDAHKVSTRPIFAGNLVRQPMMESTVYLKTNLDDSDYVMENSFWIGCHDGLENEHLDYVLKVFDNFFRSRGL